MSTTSQNNIHVILCKGQPSETEDEYMKLLKQLPVDVTYLPLLQFTWKNLPQLADCLLRPSDYEGLILTSVRAVDAIKQCIDYHFNGSSDILLAWIDMYTYCVGPKTSADAESKLGLKPCSQSHLVGNVISLIEWMVDSKISHSRPLLFPCSSIANVDGPSLLTKNHIKHQIIQVYDTEAVADAHLKFNLTLETTPATSDIIIVLFSPSNYKAISEELKTLLRGERGKKVSVIAAGPTTKSSLESDQVSVDFVMSRPTPQSLCDILHSIVDCYPKRTSKD